jgi:L-aminopeptidase/D-esterase-like protein
VGHATDLEGITGCTAVLFKGPNGAVVGVDVRGSSPGTRETDRLGPVGAVRPTHALLLTGGSAFGLAAADGVVRFLEERDIGLDVGVARIPLVSAAVLFDVLVGDPAVRPDAAMGYGDAFGDVRDECGVVLAGPRLEDGKLGHTVELLPEAARVRWGENTTLGIVATNARLTKPQANKVAQMAHDGLARAIEPVHTTVDGDIVFAASVGAVDAVVDVVGAWGARVMREAILQAVRSAESIAGIPSLSEYASG